MKYKDKVLISFKSRFKSYWFLYTSNRCLNSFTSSFLQQATIENFGMERNWEAGRSIDSGQDCVTCSRWWSETQVELHYLDKHRMWLLCMSSVWGWECQTACMAYSPKCAGFPFRPVKERWMETGDLCPPRPTGDEWSMHASWDASAFGARLDLVAALPRF